MLTRGRSKRTPTGAKVLMNRKKKKYSLAREILLTKVGPQKKKIIDTRSSEAKQRLTLADKANVLDPKTKKSKIVAIKTVLENPANMQYVKRNILNKSAVIETELGKARVTSRPGQNGVVNAVLIKD